MLEKDLVDLGVRIHSERYKRNMTIEEFADFLKLSKSTIAKLEKGKTANLNILQEVLVKLDIKVRLVLLN